jgi:hypothetical protein
VTDEREAFAREVARALAAPGDGPLAARFPGALVTAIAADAAPAERERLEIALGAVSRTLASLGVPAGRQFVLLAAGPPWPTGGRERLRSSLGIPVLAHDPHGPCFVAGRTDGGEPVEVSDELREAEALVVVGPATGGPGECRGGPFILCPGLASSATAAAWAAAARALGAAGAFAFAAEAERLLSVQLALLWDAAGRVAAGGGRERFAALAAAAGAGGASGAARGGPRAGAGTRETL